MDADAVRDILSKALKVKINVQSGDSVRFYTGYFVRIFNSTAEFKDKFNGIYYFELDAIKHCEVIANDGGEH